MEDEPIEPLWYYTTMLCLETYLHWNWHSTIDAVFLKQDLFSNLENFLPNLHIEDILLHDIVIQQLDFWKYVFYTDTVFW